MDLRRKEIDLRMEINKNAGWTVTSTPVVCPPVPAPPECEKPPMPSYPPEPETLPEPEYIPPASMNIPVPPVSHAPVPKPHTPADEATCGFGITLAMAYVPSQEFTDVYEANEGFSRGTIFADLDLPYVERGGCRYD